MAIKTLQQSFGGGEVSPDFFGRLSDSKYQSGLATCRNMIVLPHGPVVNRPGFKVVLPVADSSKRTRLIPFTFAADQTLVIELGAGYFRFHTMGGTVLSGGVPYSVVNPYAEADLFGIKYVQSNDILTLTHPGYAPRELRRLGATNWTLSTIAFAPTVAPPTGLASNKNHAQTTETYVYVVTRIGSNGEESLPSATVSIAGDLSIAGNLVQITWTAPDPNERFRVYKMRQGVFGFAAEVTGFYQFTDNNIVPDLSIAPPQAGEDFNATGEFPGAVSYFEQRRWFAGSTQQPQTIWATKSGTEVNLSRSIPVRDDDSLSVRVAARQQNLIRHLVPLQDLIALTAAGEWRVTSVNSDAITPTSISIKPQSFVGANDVTPVVVNSTMLYAAARGGHVRELGYTDQKAGYTTGDLSLRATHLFDTLQIVDMAMSKAPYPIVWFVSTSGKLLGLTYVPEQEVGAWHQHDTDGVFESCCVVSEGEDDVLYVVVRRLINGVTTRYIERMTSRLVANRNDWIFLDCATTYSGAPVTSLSGLDYLEGKTVSILADGVVHQPRLVTGGSITLDAPSSLVHIGLPITSDVVTLPLAMQLDGAFGQGRAKNVVRVFLRVHRSAGIFVGPNAGALVPVKARTTEAPGTPITLLSEELDVLSHGSWTDDGQVMVRQVDPLPLSIVSITTEVSMGG